MELLYILILVVATQLCICQIFLYIIHILINLVEVMSQEAAQGYKMDRCLGCNLEELTSGEGH